jgi:hypothetical protein
MNGHPSFVGIAGCQGLNLLSVQLGSMEAGLLCEHLFKHYCLHQPLLNSILYT